MGPAIQFSSVQFSPEEMFISKYFPSVVSGVKTVLVKLQNSPFLAKVPHLPFKCPKTALLHIVLYCGEYESHEIVLNCNF